MMMMAYSAPHNPYGQTPFQQSVQWQRASMERQGKGALPTYPNVPNQPVATDNDNQPQPTELQPTPQDHLHKTAGAAGAAVGQTATNLNEGVASKLQAFSNWAINSQMFDEAGEFLNSKDKVVAGVVGLAGYSGFLAAAHSAAGLDPYMGVLIPQRLEKAKNSPMAKLARVVDKLAPDALTPGSLKGKAPDWLRAYLGDMPEDEYIQYYIKQHHKAVNATMNKLAKGGLQPGTLPHHYAKAFENINHSLMNGAYLHHLTPDEIRQVTQNVAAPYVKHSPRQLVETAELKPLFKAAYQQAVHAHQVETSIQAGLRPTLEACKQQISQLEATPQNAEGMKSLNTLRETYKTLQAEWDASVQKRNALEHALRKESKNPIKEAGRTLKQAFHDEPVELIKDFDTALQHQPHRVAQLVNTLEDNEVSHKLMGGIVGYATHQNEYSVREQYLELMHKRLYSRGMAHLDAETGQLIKQGNLPTIAHVQASVAKVSGIGRNPKFNFPGGRWLSRITTPDNAVGSMKEKAFREIYANRTLWESLIGHDTVEAGIKALNDAKTVNDFFAANQQLSGRAGLALNDMQTLHKVLPRSLKRLNQSIAEHGQFITNQTKISESWGVKGAGRSVASSWLGMIDMVKFNLHATPSETAELKARAMASTSTTGNAVLKHAKNFLLSAAGSRGERVMFTLGAIMTFSSAAAAWIAAGKAEGKKDDTKEKAKAALRATATISIPFIGAHQLITFANRGNPLGRIMGGHYLTSAFPPSPLKIHWLTGAGAIVALGAQMVLSGMLRDKLEKGVDAATGGPPKYVQDMKNLEKAKAAISMIQDERYENLKKEDVDLIRRYPKAMKEEKVKLTEEQLKTAERMAGKKSAEPITPEIAALMYSLANAPTTSSSASAMPKPRPPGH